MNVVGIGECVVARDLVLGLETQHLPKLVLVSCLEMENSSQMLS